MALDKNIVEDIISLLKKGEKIGRVSVQKRYNVSESEARVYIATARYLLEQSDKQRNDVIRKQIQSIKKREDKERM